MFGSQVRSDLLGNGYCVVSGIVSRELLMALREQFNPAQLQQKSAKFSQAGAFINLDLMDSLVVELLTWPPALRVLRQAGYPAPKLHSFYASTKPPGSDGLIWHSDVFYEYEGDEPPEVFLLYYLEDTTPINGCLRVVPGSHLRPNITKEALHTEGAADSGHLEGEIDVPIRAGELFIGDRRLLHATHPNVSEEWRTCITISYASVFDRLPKAVRDMIVNNPCLPPEGWWVDPASDLDSRLRAILPVNEAV